MIKFFKKILKLLSNLFVLKYYKKDEKVKITINDDIEIELYQSQIDLIEKTVKGKDLSEKFENILRKYTEKEKLKDENK